MFPEKKFSPDELLVKRGLGHAEQLSLLAGKLGQDFSPEKRIADLEKLKASSQKGGFGAIAADWARLKLEERERSLDTSEEFRHFII